MIDDHHDWRLSRPFPMASTLRNRLSELAKSFSAGVLDAIRGASLEELLSEPAGRRSTAARPVSASAAPAGGTRRRSGRLPRRSAGDISKVVEAIIGLLSEKPGGLRAEEIRQKLGLQAKELPRPLKEGLDSGRLTKSGRKRATTYFAGAASRGRKAAAPKTRAGKRGGPKKARQVTRKAAKAKRRGSRGAAKKRRRGRAKG
jgi:hypothetical protein